MRRNQFVLKKFIHENENTKTKMKIKKCILCGAEFKFDWEIVFHECDPNKIKNS